MRINKIQKISFTRNVDIIDSHTHDKPMSSLGKQTDTTNLSRFLNKSIESDGDTLTLKKVFPSSLDCCIYKNGKPQLDEISGNESLISAYKNTNINEFLATCQPKSGNVKNVETIFENHKKSFVGLKFHPESMELGADSLLYDPYLKFAKKHQLPCVFHSFNSKDYIHPQENWKSLKSEFSRPEQIYALAKRHPDVPVVMAHCGGIGEGNVEEAINTIITSAKNNDAKLYTDISWLDIDVKDAITQKKEMPNLIDAIKKLKNSEAGDLTSRIMFGTDAPIDRFAVENAEDAYTDFVKNIHGAIKKNFGDEADDIIDKVFYKNADDLFFKKTWTKIGENSENIVKKTLEKASDYGSNVVKKLSKTKLAFGIGAGVLGFMGLVYCSTRGKHEKNQNGINPVQNPTLNIMKNEQVPSVFQKFSK